VNIMCLKIVGGMAWCLTTSSVDVDFDVTFKENPNIKDKMFDFLCICWY
jgi:hypothetical protein